MFILKKNTKFIIAGLMGYVLLLIIHIMLNFGPQAPGLEMSIYDSMPTSFWFVVVMTFGVGYFLMWVSIIDGSEIKWPWLLGFLLVIMLQLTLLVIPFFREYFFYGRGDALSHLGYMRDIIETKFLSQRDFYPIVHILGVQICLLFGLSLKYSVPIIYIMFNMIFIMGMVLLSKSLVSGKHLLFFITMSMPFFYSYFHMNIHPSILSIFALPIFLYIYNKRGEMKNYFPFVVLFLIVAIWQVFFHPVSAVYIIIALVTTGCLELYANNLKPKAIYSKLGSSLLIMFIVYCVWYLSFYAIANKIGIVYNWLIYGEGNTLVQKKLMLISESGVGLLELCKVFFLKYGHITIYFLLALISTVMIWRLLLQKRKTMYKQWVYCNVFVVMLVLGVAELFGHFIESEPIRVLRMAILYAIIANGLILYHVVRANFIHGWLIFMCVFVVVVVGIFNLYSSPLVYKINSQLTNAEIKGFKWAYQFKSVDLPAMVNNYNNFRRYQAYCYGMDSLVKNAFKLDDTRLPSHFGCTDNKYEITNAERFILTTEYDRKVFEVFPEVSRSKVNQYNSRDYFMLQKVSAINNIYRNGGFEVFHVLN